MKKIKDKELLKAREEGFNEGKLYGILLSAKEICKLNKKRHYWEMKYKRLYEKRKRE